ncbi:hypothetical protein L210DRAFT_3763836 [Boletus edulis BED1]|uniref:Uncharacterized protein n=1 Tax=Boletus edulis BED1 TaxID=1328754 RepID=A0AAD4BK11_BOLED|nr:hypothetical protein L210DRAFT_3763836 [Boletus edulis BED1]
MFGLVQGLLAFWMAQRLRFDSFRVAAHVARCAICFPSSSNFLNAVAIVLALPNALDIAHHFLLAHLVSISTQRVRFDVALVPGTLPFAVDISWYRHFLSRVAQPS